MNHFSSDQIFDVGQAYLEDLRREAAVHRLAELARGNRPSRIKSIVNSISEYSKRLTSQKASCKTQATTLCEQRA